MQQQLKSMILTADSSLRGGARASSEPAQRNTELRDDWTRFLHISYALIIWVKIKSSVKIYQTKTYITSHANERCTCTLS